jgi:hypothetical protein
MSTRYSKNQQDGFSIPLGHEGNNIPDAIEVPSNMIEDVDKAIFELFDKHLPFQYDRSGTMTRVPVIFASGERFAVLRRRKPLRDKTGALILPIVSIMRTSVAQTNAIGGGVSETQTQIIRRKLSKEDNYYQRLINSRKEQNSRDLAIDSLRPNSEDRLRSERRDLLTVPEGMQPVLGKNIYEIYEIPPVKFFTATYEVTFWTQYTQQMNDLLMAMMSLYQNNVQRTFRLQTSKGYWFVGYVGEQMSNGDNFDGFADDERLIKYSFEVTVPSYLIGADFPGSMKSLRRFLSAPEISFASWYEDPDQARDTSMGIPSGDPSDYIFDDLRLEGESKTAQSIGIARKAFQNSNNASNLEGYALDRTSSINSKGETTYRGVQVFVSKRSSDV